jgi:hypothetical protein
LYRALLFDLDGTLAETDSLHLPTWVDVLRPYGVEVDEEFYRESISGRSTSEIVEELLPDLSSEEGRELADAKEASFRERAHMLEPLPGLLAFIKEAKNRSLSLALVTNAPEENVEAILLVLELGSSSTRSCSPRTWARSSPIRPPTVRRSTSWASFLKRPSPSRTRPPASPRPSGPTSLPSASLPLRSRRRSRKRELSWSQETSRIQGSSSYWITRTL